MTERKTGSQPASSELACVEIKKITVSKDGFDIPKIINADEIGL